MNKKLVLLLVLVLSVLIFSSCGNRETGVDRNQTFTNAYINLDGEWVMLEVKTWRDFEEGDEVQIVTTDGAVYLTHYCNVVLEKR